MSVSAKIGFKQGATTSDPGVAMIGTTGSSVTVYTEDNLDNSTYTYTLVVAPLASGLVLGVMVDGRVPIASFTPDVPGGYLWDLVTTDKYGNKAHDQRVFQVREVTGRIIPPAASRDDALNFIISGVMNKSGWAPFIGEYLRAYDADGAAVHAVKATATTGADQTLFTIDKSVFYATGDLDDNAAYRVDVRVQAKTAGSHAEAGSALLGADYYIDGGSLVLVPSSDTNVAAFLGGTTCRLFIAGKTLLVQSTPGVVNVDYEISGRVKQKKD